MNLNELPQFKVSYILMGGFGTVFAVYWIVNYLRIKSCRRVNAKIVDYVTVTNNKYGGKKRMLYAPVYEYEDCGEIKRYTSKQAFIYQEPFGTEAVLLISKNGDVTDKTTVI